MVAVGFNTFRPKTDNTEFVVKNITDREVKVFGMKIAIGSSYDLMAIPSVSEADIKHSLLKGEVRTSLENKKISIVSSSIDLVQYGSDLINYIENSTDRNVMGIRDKVDDAVEIRSLRDLPDPINGVITLPDNNSLYYVYGTVDLGTNRLLITGTNTALLGRNPRVDIITGSVSGSDALLGSTRGIQIENIAIINADGYAINIDGNGTDHIILNMCAVLYSKYAGSIGNAMVLHADSLMVKDCDTGLQLTSTEYVDINALSIVLNSTSTDGAFTITAGQTFDNLIFADSFIKTTNAAQTGLSIDTSTTIINRAVFNDNVIYGTGTALGGITKATPRFWFAGNSGIVDSQTIGGMGFSGNTADTTISVAGTFVDIGTGSTSPPHSAFSLDTASERVSLAGTFPSQSLQYDGYEDRHFDILVALSVATAGGTEKNSASRLLLNGSEITNSEFRFVSKGAGSVAYNLTQILSNGDQVSIQITNIDDTSSLVVYSARLTLIAT